MCEIINPVSGGSCTDLETKITEQRICSANWHINSKCNYRCKFCFAKEMKGEVTDLQEAEKILIKLKNDLDIEKINFVGGEPLMHPNIFELVKISKTLGLSVSITTNGYFLNETLISRLVPFVDWIGVSIDSANEETEKALGRGNGNHVARSIDVCSLVHKYGIRLKINTTVTQLNYREEIKELIAKLDPERWKVFQFLHIIGQNDGAVNSMAISASEFQEFKEKNKGVKLGGVFQSLNLIRIWRTPISCLGPMEISSLIVDRSILKYP